MFAQYFAILYTVLHLFALKAYRLINGTKFRQLDLACSLKIVSYTYMDGCSV